MSRSEQCIFGAGVGLCQTQDMEQMVTNTPLLNGFLSGELLNGGR